jgi:predicted Zn-dependent protease
MIKKISISIIILSYVFFITKDIKANQDLEIETNDNLESETIIIDNKTIKKLKNPRKVIIENYESNPITKKKLSCNDIKKDLSLTESWSSKNNKLAVYINDLPYHIRMAKNFRSDINLNNLVIESFKEWEKESKKLFEFRITYEKKDANVIVNWFEYFKNSNDFSYSNKLTYYLDIDKKISYVNIPLSFKKYTSFKANDENIFYLKDELSIVIKHEIGHALGLQDSSGIMENIHVSNFFPVNAKINKINISTLNDIFNNPKQSYLCNDNLKNVSDFRQNDVSNYLCYAPSKQTLNSDGKSFIRNYARWEKSQFPLKVFINLPLKKEHRVGNPEYYKELVIESIKKWSDSSKLISFVISEKENDSDIVVKWNDFFEHKSYWGTCQTFTDPLNPNKKTKCIVNLAVRSQPYWYREKNELFDENTLKSIIVHEFGHALGLDHGPDINGATGRGTLISQRDLSSLKELYSIPINNNLLCNL